MAENNFRYSMKRVVCNGKIKSCEFCKDSNNGKTENGKPILMEGYCSKCGRPLWKKPGDDCGFILAYLDRHYNQKDKVHIKCKLCSTVTTV